MSIQTLINAKELEKSPQPIGVEKFTFVLTVFGTLHICSNLIKCNT